MNQTLITFNITVIYAALNQKSHKTRSVTKQQPIPKTGCPVGVKHKNDKN